MMENKEYVVKFYKTPFGEKSNFVVDDISQLLTNLGDKVVYTSVKNALIPSTLNLTRTFAMSGDNVVHRFFNYAVVFNKDIGSATLTPISFYFVKEVNWTGLSSCKVVMKLDTLMTYWSKLKFTSRTNIIREHRDRYQRPATVTSTMTLTNIIDRTNEGLNPSLVNCVDHGLVLDSTNYQTPWYLVYAQRNMNPSNVDNPVVIYATQETSNIGLAASNFGGDKPQIGGPFSSTNYLPKGFSVYATTSRGQTIIKAGGLTFYSGDKSTNDNTGVPCELRAFEIYRSNVTYYLYGLYYSGDTYPYTFEKRVQLMKSEDGWTFMQVSDFYGYAASGITFLPSIESMSTTNYKSFRAGSFPEVRNISFSALPKSDPSFVKIIEVPYIPATSFRYNSALGAYQLQGFTFDVGRRMWCRTIPSKPMYTMLNSVSLDPYRKVVIHPNAETLRSEVDPKLFSSEFSALTFVYHNDRFTVPIDRWEGNINIEFYITGFMTSEKGFRFRADGMSTSFSDAEHCDTIFGNWMISNDSTEIPVQNSAYADYVKTGYNYDMEVNRRQNQMTAISTTINSINSTATAAQLALTNPSVKTLSSVGLNIATSLFSNIYSAKMSCEMTKLRENQKLQQLAMQGASLTGMSGVDFLDLNNVKLEWFMMRPMSDVYSKVSDLFYYHGYSHPYQEEPDTTSRYWFNFIQCDPDFDFYTMDDSVTWQSYVDDISQRMQSGVTVFHGHNGTFDFDQVKENWESWMLQ